MQPDGLRPLTERRNHSSAISALARITRDEGMLDQWACCLPTVARAMALNISQLAVLLFGGQGAPGPYARL